MHICIYMYIQYTRIYIRIDKIIYITYYTHVYNIHIYIHANDMTKKESHTYIYIYTQIHMYRFAGVVKGLLSATSRIVNPYSE